MTNRSEMESAFVAEVLEAMRHLGAKSDLLGLVGSWRDSREDGDVVAALKGWNEKARQDEPGGQKVE